MTVTNPPAREAVGPYGSESSEDLKISPVPEDQSNTTREQS